HQVLKDIDLKIEPGEFFAFLGPSGSGKSTLLRLIAGFGPPPSGRVLIGSDDVTHLPPWKRNVGMVFQNYALWPHMTVRRNVAFGLEERRLPAKEIRARVDAALELVGLEELADRRPSQLSGGQQQRVAIARTIVVEPRVLLLDEPLSNLDANLRIRMRRDIRELQRRLGITTIFVTHDQEEANTIADRMAVLNDGILQQVGAPMELYDEPANRFVAHFLGTANLLEGAVRNESGRSVFYGPGALKLPLHDAVGETANATAMFRPQSVRIHPSGGDGNTAGAVLSGRVEDREFLGGLIRYTVDLGEATVLVDDEHQRGAQSFAVGDPVSLVLDTSQIRVLTT
ncbi:MAG TPA: ABC transporter ATP-binding protein, partial [Alphaproteobacteria bacterium]|nr:ABC transporter ATP-binding protein [Alphaproteobacteria bacterium]